MDNFIKVNIEWSELIWIKASREFGRNGLRFCVGRGQFCLYKDTKAAVMQTYFLLQYLSKILARYVASCKFKHVNQSNGRQL
jgi:hypothetical protein